MCYVKLIMVTYLPRYLMKVMLDTSVVVSKSFWTQPEVVFTCSAPRKLLLTEIVRLIYAFL